jgi:hypothetical protein
VVARFLNETNRDGDAPLTPEVQEAFDQWYTARLRAAADR